MAMDKIKFILDKFYLLLVSFLFLIIIVLIIITIKPLPKKFYLKIPDKELELYEKKIFSSNKCIYLNKARQVLLNYKAFSKDYNLTRKKIKRIKTYIKKCEMKL